MKKDIPVRKVKDIVMAIVPRDDHPEILSDEEGLWDCFLVNMDRDSIKSVIVSSKGYGQLNGESLKTTTLRHFFEEIEGETYAQVEPIPRKLFDLTNEYWVSFLQDGYMYDKKYVFVIGSISKQNFTEVPILSRKGVMIR